MGVRVRIKSSGKCRKKETDTTTEDGDYAVLQMFHKNLLFWGGKIQITENILLFIV